MAIYGIGSNYKSEPQVDMTKEFINNDCVCIGYEYEDSTSLYEILKRMKIGDFVYIKSYSAKNNKTIFVKAIGIVIGTDLEEKYSKDNCTKLGYGRTIKWVKDFSDKSKQINLIPSDIKNNVYNNTIYEEYSINIINNILNLVFNSSGGEMI